MIEAKCSWNDKKVTLPKEALDKLTAINPVCSGCKQEWHLSHFIAGKEEDKTIAAALGKTVEFNETHYVSVHPDPSGELVVRMCECSCESKFV